MRGESVDEVFGGVFGDDFDFEFDGEGVVWIGRGIRGGGVDLLCVDVSDLVVFVVGVVVCVDVDGEECEISDGGGG